MAGETLQFRRNLWNQFADHPLFFAQKRRASYTIIENLPFFGANWSPESLRFEGLSLDGTSPRIRLGKQVGWWPEPKEKVRLPHCSGEQSAKGEEIGRPLLRRSSQMIAERDPRIANDLARPPQSAIGSPP